MSKLIEYMQAKKLIEKYGIKTVKASYVSSAEDAVKFAKTNGAPIALKLISDKALHKTKSGVIKLNLTEPKQISNAYNQLIAKSRRFKPFKILAQRMSPNGIEIIVGGRVDPQFGKLILLGLGGIYVEAFKDFTLRVCPLTMHDAEQMVTQLRSRAVIAPDTKHTAMLAQIVMKASKMFLENSIEELDLNPIILHDGTYDAVDLRLIR